jgi:hypothetical protein
MNNRQRLIDLIAEFKLDILIIAEMLKVKRDTVDHWLMSTESKFNEEIPDMAIELPELKLGAKHQECNDSGSGL